MSCRNAPEKTAIAYNGTYFGDFSPQREKTVIICHGFTDSGNSGWMNPLKDLLLQQVGIYLNTALSSDKITLETRYTLQIHY